MVAAWAGCGGQAVMGEGHRAAPQRCKDKYAGGLGAGLVMSGRTVRGWAGAGGCQSRGWRSEWWRRFVRQGSGGTR